MDLNSLGNIRRNRRALRPKNTVLPVITGTGTVGQTLTCSTGTWTNTPISYKYQWSISDGTSVAGTPNNNTYVIAAGDSGKSITCVVIASNASGPGAVARAAKRSIT